MTRPLLICDCDEVLLHMVTHFRDWLGDAHGIDFAIGKGDFAHCMTRRDGRAAPTQQEMWVMLGGFFPGEMHRQTLVEGAADALAVIAEVADVVILTNLQDHCRDPRAGQLARFGIHHPVACNTGGKGEAVARLVAEHGDPVTVFVDDLGFQHASVALAAPHVHRLQMVSEPLLAPHVEADPAAHARIDDWPRARDWILARFAGGVPAPGLTATVAAC